MAGIKETKEFLDGNIELMVFLVARLKDGADFSDALALWQKLSSDDVFKAKLERAYDGVKAVPAEIKDVDFAEGVELSKLLLDAGKRLVDALK